MKKFVSIFFTILLVLSLCCPIFAFGAMDREQDDVPLLQENEFNQRDFLLSDLQTDTLQMTKLQKAIYNMLINYESKLDTTSYNIKNNEFQIVYVNVINDHPELFYVSGTYTYTYNRISGNVVYIEPHYVLTKSETQQAKSIFEKGVNKALRQVDDSMSDVQKALVIHEYLCNLGTYPYLGENNQYDNEFYHSAYGIFYDGNTVCAGYTLAYSVIMNALGIPCKYVSSEQMSHAWNAIKINNRWYNVDITFDDLNLNGFEGKNIQSTNFHTCFLKSDVAFATEKSFSHTDFNVPDGITCTDTTFDDYFWDDMMSNIYVEDGNYIYLDYNATNRNVDIIREAPNGTKTKLNKTSYMAYSLGTINGVFMTFAKLVSYKGQLYFTAMEDYITKLFYLDSKTGEILQIAELPSYCFSIGEVNDELYFVTYPNRESFEKSTINRNNKDLFKMCYQKILIMDVNNDFHTNAKDYVHLFKK